MPGRFSSGIGLALGLALSIVEKPEGARQDDSVEEVGADGNNRVNRARLNQFLADFQLAAARVARRVRHDEPGAAMAVE